MKHRKSIRSLVALVTAAVLLVGLVPGSAWAASSSEIKETINGLKQENAEIQAQINAIRSLPISEAEKEAIFCGNARKLLGI